MKSDKQTKAGFSNIQHAEAKQMNAASTIS